MKTGFVFDLDGTLVDSIPGIARGLNLALESLGYPEHSVEAIRGMVGRAPGSCAWPPCVDILTDPFRNPPLKPCMRVLCGNTDIPGKTERIPYAGIL